ncbi:MAG: hypothetical protein K8T25_07385 [Planctomycetia bacterium]|nr:hypothetical protein [Planctomycetia bacterium]
MSGDGTSKEYPRVLVVSPVPMPRTGATGQTLSRLFEGWPEEAIAQVAMAQSFDGQPTFIARTFVANGWVLPLDRLARMALPANRPADAVPLAATSLSGDVRTSRAARLRRHVSAAVDIGPVLPNTSLRRWVRAFGPQVIYSALGNVRMIRLTVALADMMGCPIVPHFMDDFPGSMYRDGQLCGAARRALLRGLKQVFARSRGGMCISALMAREYERRYGLPFRDFMNCVDQPWFIVAPRANDGSPVSFVYCGGLHLGRDQVLLRLAEVLEQFNAMCQACTLTIHTPLPGPFVSKFERLGCVSLDSVAPSEVRPALALAEVLVHVESFAPENIEYTRWSISTKVPEYLASGKAILAIGPAELASMQHLKGSGAAILATSVDDRALAESAQRLLCAGIRDTMGEKGRRFADAWHSAKSVRERFRASLQEWSLSDGTV